MSSRQEVIIPIVFDKLFHFLLINSENCWGRLYNQDDPDSNTKIYRNKCCILCKPGEYLNRDLNTCVNCEAGYACKSTYRNISQIFSKIELEAQGPLFERNSIKVLIREKHV